jgi:hypothetical protein
MKMKIFTIDAENNITIHASVKEAEAVPGSERFSNEAALAKLAANWPATRLVEIWNSLPGATEVKKFKDRATAASRIWKAIQTLGETATAEAAPQPDVAPVAEPPQHASEVAQPEATIPESTNPAPATPLAPQTADVAPEAAPAKTKATRAKKADKPATDANGPREGSKTSQVISMLQRDGGTTLEDIMAAMGWLKHTTRSMLSAGGSLTKKHGLVIASEKIGDKRTYRIAK